MRFFIARFEHGRRLQRRVETALMQAIYSLPGPEGQFLEPGLKLEPRFDDEDPMTVLTSPIGLIEGLPDQIVA